MTRATVTMAACATLLCAGTALATPTPEQKCDYARITAWAKYARCVEVVLAKDAKGVTFDEFAAFAKCRHTYFKNWTAFQSKASLAGSTCDEDIVGSRFTDNGVTVTDNLSGLVWEKKTNDGSVHNGNAAYSWSLNLGLLGVEDGTAFTYFLINLNYSWPGFAESNGWRLPTLAELQTIVLDFACTGAGNGATCRCPVYPCLAFTDSNAVPDQYWSATSNAFSNAVAWRVYFSNGTVSCNLGKGNSAYVRAVRGGL
jgi:hypothetical protein